MDHRWIYAEGFCSDDVRYALQPLTWYYGLCHIFHIWLSGFEENPTWFTLRDRRREIERCDLKMKSFFMALHKSSTVLPYHRFLTLVARWYFPRNSVVSISDIFLKTGLDRLHARCLDQHPKLVMILWRLYHKDTRVFCFVFVDIFLFLTLDNSSLFFKC